MKHYIRAISLLLLTALLATACGAQRMRSAESRTQMSPQSSESLAAHRQTYADQITSLLDAAMEQSMKSLLLQEEIPAAKAVVTIPLENLLNLPPGAGYTARSKNGRASLELTREGENIVATSRCDSIARRCIYMQREVFRQRTKIDSLTTLLADRITAAHRADSLLALHSAAEHAVTEKPPAFRWFKWFLTGILTGVTATTLLLKTGIIKRVIAAIKRLLL